jgi:pyruvate/oxaloacetate carboxyltransferase
MNETAERIPECYFNKDYEPESNQEEEIGGPANDFQVAILYLLRDGEQSSLPDGTWCFDKVKLAEMAVAAAKSGFNAIEIAGGRSLEMSALQRVNIFPIIKYVREALDKEGFEAVALQALFRGKNGMGFERYHPSVLKALSEEHCEAGIGVNRKFDALNDINNIDIHPGTHNQLAISYDRSFSAKHYIAYAELLKEKGADSICIKDMGGQLSVESLEEILPGIKKLGLKVTLHTHSLDEEKTFNVIKKALDLGIHQIEVAPMGLDGGASHLRIEKFMDEAEIKRKISNINQKNLGKLNELVRGFFAETPRKEIGTELEEDEAVKVLKSFCEAGIPGGAIPSILSDIAKNLPAKPFLENLDDYFKEVKQVRKDAGSPPLVTPTADIISKQAIFNLMSKQAKKDRYMIKTPRFAKLIFGHYGHIVKDYSQKEREIGLADKEVYEKFANDKEFEDLERLIPHRDDKEGEIRHIGDHENGLKTINDFLSDVDEFKEDLTAILNRLSIPNPESVSSLFLNSFGTERQNALYFAMTENLDIDKIREHKHTIINYQMARYEKLCFKLSKRGITCENIGEKDSKELKNSLPELYFSIFGIEDPEEIKSICIRALALERIVA